MKVWLVLPVIWILWLSQALAVAASIAKPGCSQACGNVGIPYPFGVGPDCYLNESFAVTCDTSVTPPKAFLSSIGMELLGISLSGLLRVNNAVISSNCSNMTSTATGADLSGTPFMYSNTLNRFTSLGCDSFALLYRTQGIIGGCLTMCNGTQKSDGCYGLNCCQTTIPPYLRSFGAGITNGSRGSISYGCKTAFMVEQEWFETQSTDAVSQMEYVPAILEWGTVQGSCDPSEVSVSFCNHLGYCWTKLTESDHMCVCRTLQDPDDANFTKYINGGCEGCMNQKIDSCRLFCMYTPGSNNCSCPPGYEVTSGNGCQPSNYHTIDSTKSQVKYIVIGCGSGFGFLLLLCGIWWSYKAVKRREAIKLKEKYFKRNGGLLLRQHLSSGKDNVEQAKLFTSEELKKATDNYHVDRILGQGGQGTVYKGMLTDGRLVAVKKSKVVDESKLEQFINEIGILSTINHRNVVKLLGCCLETEVPLLVYEFIPNGTLFQYIHDQNAEFLITWEMRLRIAAEVAGAISYLHSAASVPIYHRDIKSSNILLDAKYKAKVSDFGTSKSIEIDQTHVTTQVQGTFGYLDPEFFQSSQFTEKSDVYSFGVVLIELLTGKRPISLARSAEQRSLATYFLQSMEKNQLFDILDERVLKEGRKEELVAVAKLAKRCLNLNGKKRPTMRAVAMELEAIRESQGGCSTIDEDCEEFDYAVSGVPGPWDAISSSSTGTFLNTSVSVTADMQPLLSTKK